MMKLFEPGFIGNLKLKNRVQFAPMGLGGTLYESDGKISQRAIDYFIERAKNDIGLIRVGYTRTNREFELPNNTVFTRYPFADGRLATGWMNELAEQVHDYRAKISIQLTAGMGRIVGLSIQNGGRPISPSVNNCFWPPHKPTEALNKDEIKRMIDYFAVSAQIIKASGIDAIELHGHEGYLFDQFKSSLWNKRNDEYGGDLTGRLRFSLEVIAAIKDAVGKDFPLIYRFGLTHFLDGGREVEEGIEIAKILEGAGVHALDIDAGCYETWYHPHPPTTMQAGVHVNLAAMVKKAVNIPVIAVGKLGFPDIAEKVLLEGKADFIALGRPLLADPQWLVKVKENRIEDIRPCVGCHDGCLGRIYAGKYNSCTVNPTVGMEKTLVINKAKIKKNVLVIGGGPAGLEAARVSALRGHNVEIWEKNNSLGGVFRLDLIPDFKIEYGLFTKYLVHQINKLGVTVTLNKHAVYDEIIQHHPDVVFIATGACAQKTQIKGINNNNVLYPNEVLQFKSDVKNKKVVVIGGGLVGCELALQMSNNKAHVTVLEKESEFAKDMFYANRLHLFELLRLGEVKLIHSALINEVINNEVRVQQHGKNISILFDIIVIATGLVSNNQLLSLLEGKVSELYDIGDSTRPGKLINAIWDGYRTARVI